MSDQLTLTKIANEMSKAAHDQQLRSVLADVEQYPVHQQSAIVQGVELLQKEAAAGNLPPQTPLGYLTMAIELVKAAEIQANPEFQKEARNAFDAGQLAWQLLADYVAQQQQQA